MNRARDFWGRYRKNRPAAFAAGILCILVTIAISYPWFIPYDPLSPVDKPLLAPGGRHLMGTDDVGRDILAGVLEGTRVSLIIGFCSAITSAIIGIFIGSMAGYYGRTLDAVLMRVTEMFQIIPMFLLAVLIVAVYGANLLFVILVIGLLSWPSTARIVRAQFLSLKEREFVIAARASGYGTGRIIFVEVLPNAMPPVIVNVSLQMAAAIIIEAGLSYLGLSDPSLISWGKMMYAAQGFLRRAAWMAIFPGLMVFMTTLSLNLVGDGLNDALNPRLEDR
jgi:peptide/nickel transport system permease protein